MIWYLIIHSLIVAAIKNIQKSHGRKDRNDYDWYTVVTVPEEMCVGMVVGKKQGCVTVQRIK